MSISRDALDRSEAVSDDGADDARRVRLVLAGHADAYDGLVRRYQRRAYVVAYRLLSNRADAEDVAQEALLRGYRSLHQLADAERFGPWLMRIVSNLSLNYRRSRKSAATAELDETLESTGVSHADGSPIRLTGGIGDDARERELRGAVAAAMETLPEKQRQALVLSSVAGLPQKEVAEMLDCSVELVKWNVFQARKTLRLALDAFVAPDRE